MKEEKIPTLLCFERNKDLIEKLKTENEGSNKNQMNSMECSAEEENDGMQNKVQ